MGLAVRHFPRNRRTCRASDPIEQLSNSICQIVTIVHLFDQILY
uniref:Uncharacterized protein n=1 Tax=Setaria viridis TaxID=4556 RepID=A0A4U6SQ83_SETVI|nr:hypothetical protein SEVIR_9G043850v2 [Setaria viridis]